MKRQLHPCRGRQLPLKETKGWQAVVMPSVRGKDLFELMQNFSGQMPVCDLRRVLSMESKSGWSLQNRTVGMYEQTSVMLAQHFLDEK